MRVLVTGGNGFIGKKIIHRLLSDGNDVVVIDKLNTLDIPPNKNLTFHSVDITQKDELNSLNVTNVNAVLHLAAQSSGPRSFYIPEEDIRLNILGTLNNINFCIQNKIKQLLFASSFVVYGDSDNEMLGEASRCEPKSVYAGSKLACEHLLKNYAQLNGINWNILRMFNVYGPGQDISKPDQGVVGIFMNMLMKSNEIQVKGSLDRFRDLVYIDDVVEIWHQCLLCGKPNTIYNVGSGKKTTFHDLISTLAKVMGVVDSLKISVEAGIPGDILGCYADISLSRNDLKMLPSVDLFDGVSSMYKSVLHNA